LRGYRKTKNSELNRNSDFSHLMESEMGRICSRLGTRNSFKIPGGNPEGKRPVGTPERGWKCR